MLFGGLSSLLYGVADYLGGEGARRAPASSVVLWSGLLSFPLILVVAVSVGGDAGWADYSLGLLAGTSGALGLVALFAGLGRGRAAAVAPVAAAMAAVLPVVVAVVAGERPSLLAWVGVTVAIPAILLCSGVEGRIAAGWAAGLPFGLAAGLGFGGFTAVISYTSAESNLLPLIASRAATMFTVLVLAGVGAWKLVGFASVPRGIVAGNALLDVSGNVALLLAVRAGSLALAAVAASFYPAVTVLLASARNGEPLAPVQAAGLGLTVVAMSIIALG